MKLVVGKAYAIDFLDHCAPKDATAWVALADLDSIPSLIRALGFVAKADQVSVTLTLAAIRDGEVSTSAFTIVRGAIVAIHGPISLPPIRRTSAQSGRKKA